MPHKTTQPLTHQVNLAVDLDAQRIHELRGGGTLEPGPWPEILEVMLRSCNSVSGGGQVSAAKLELPASLQTS